MTERAEVGAEIAPSGCGGCRGEGAHQKFCPHRPGYHPWQRLAALAEDIADQIGSNDPGLANRAYSLSAGINAAIPDHPFRRTTPPASINPEEG